jgi:hypothetical protein
MEKMLNLLLEPTLKIMTEMNLRKMIILLLEKNTLNQAQEQMSK